MNPPGRNSASRGDCNGAGFEGASVYVGLETFAGARGKVEKRSLEPDGKN